MVNEILLFIKEIKPAILIPQKSLQRIERVGIDVNKYYTAVFRNGIIISHKEIPIITNTDNVKLGEVLGYYPKSCEVLYSKREPWEENEFINFGGIHFNTSHLFNEAFEWCNKMYLTKMLEHFESIKCERWVGKRNSNNKVIKELIETKIIER